MSKIFYDHIVNREEILILLDQYKIDPEEKQELIDLIDGILHHHTLNVILSHLPKEYHSEFISKLHAAPHDPELLNYINARVTVDIELEIIKQTQKVKRDLLSEFKKAHTKNH